MSKRLQEFTRANGRRPDSAELWELYKALDDRELSAICGQMYFLRHGETVANEQNMFAGRNETSLSELGVEQARQSGKKMADKKVVFDEIHISSLMRTYETAVTILEELRQKNVRICVSDKLLERDFGFYTKLNKNLMCKAAGYKTYEDSLHSLIGLPPGGETFMEMYRRTREYYREVLLPKVAEGKTILVICHKYIVEMFAMIIAGKTMDEYHDMRLPNTQAMSASELKKFAMEDSKIQKEIADRTVFLGPILIFAAAIAGAGLKLHMPMAPEIPRTVLLLSIGTLLAVSSFFVMLGIHTGVVLTALKTPQYIFSKQLLPWVLRIVLVTTIVFLVNDPVRGCVWLLAAMPPALTIPVFSILWGGNLYAAIRVMVLLSCLVPLAMPLLFWGLGIYNLSVIVPFALTLLFSIFLPAGLAQWLRAKKPIMSGRIVTRWKWLSVIAVVLISLLSTYSFTPSTLSSMSYEDLFAFQKQGLYLVGVMCFMKIFAFGSYFFIEAESPVKSDLYIAHSTPNIFLWLSIVSMIPGVGYLGFWGCLVFAIGILFDEWLFVHLFRINLQQELCRQAQNLWQHKRGRGSVHVPTPALPAELSMGLEQ